MRVCNFCSLHHAFGDLWGPSGPKIGVLSSIVDGLTKELDPESLVPPTVSLQETTDAAEVTASASESASDGASASASASESVPQRTSS